MVLHVRVHSCRETPKISPAWCASATGSLPRGRFSSSGRAYDCCRPTVCATPTWWGLASCLNCCNPVRSIQFLSRIVQSWRRHAGIGLMTEASVWAHRILGSRLRTLPETPTGRLSDFGLRSKPAYTGHWTSGSLAHALPLPWAHWPANRKIPSLSLDLGAPAAAIGLDGAVAKKVERHALIRLASHQAQGAASRNGRQVHQNAGLSRRRYTGGAHPDAKVMIAVGTAARAKSRARGLGWLRKA